MRQVLASAIGSALGILFLGVLIVGGLWAYSAFEENGTAKVDDPLLVDSPPSLRILEQAQVLKADNFSVQGVLANSGDTDWGYVTIELLIKSQNVLVAGCDTSVFDLSPGNRRPFLVTCEKTTSRLPFPSQYEVRVVQARRRER